jgi:glycosyltransferase involved in cell wall biosynthesis
MIYQTKSLELPKKTPWRVRKLISNWLLFPDGIAGWIPFGKREGLKLVREHGIEAIYSSSPPPTVHMIGLYLKRKTEKPWIADFRDLWMNNPNIVHPSAFHKSYRKKTEEKIVFNADIITCANKGELITLQEKYSKLLPKPKIRLLTNGYDPDDFADVQPINFGKFTIVHSGAIYSIRPLDSLLTALQELFIENQDLKHDISVILMGTVGKNDKKKIAQAGLEDVVKCIGYKPHKETIAYLLGASTLLLFHTSTAYSTKLFEYLFAQKPILGLVPPTSDAANLVREANCGIIVDFNDIDAIKTAIFEMFTKFKESKLNVSPKKEIIQYYNRENLTEQLASMLNSLVKNQS